MLFIAKHEYLFLLIKKSESHLSIVLENDFFVNHSCYFCDIVWVNILLTNAKEKIK